MSDRRIWIIVSALACAVAAPWALALAQDQPAPKAGAADNGKAAAAAPGQDLPGPPPVQELDLLPTLHTVAIKHGTPNHNVHMVDARALPSDRSGIWVLDFSFKPLRMTTIEIPGKGRRDVYYLYYKVVNRTKKPVRFVPRFTLVTDSGQPLEDAIIPQAVKKIQARENETIPLLGSIDIMGVLPPSTKQGVDDTVFGVAVWDNVDPKSDALHIYVRGLSDGFQVLASPKDGKPIVRYKTLRLDFIRRGDEHGPHEKEIELGDPPTEWIYW